MSITNKMLNKIDVDIQNLRGGLQPENLEYWYKKITDETIEILGDAVEKSKLGYNDKSKALKRLHKATVKSEGTFTPISFLNDLMDYEWKHSEKNGGY